MPKVKCNTLLRCVAGLCQASLVLLVVPGCAGDADVAAAVQPSTPAEPSLLGASPAPTATPPPAPQPSGASTPPAPAPSGSGAGEGAPPTQPPPQPTATETNFFSAGCRSDAECPEGRRCQFPTESPPDAGARIAAPRPLPPPMDTPVDAGTEPAPDTDAAAPPLTPRGQCVAR